MTSLATHFENGRLTIRDNWMRLDFNKDGKVTLNDIKENLLKAYQFVVGYQYVEKFQDVKFKLYNKAIEYMKNDISVQKKEDKIENIENVEKIENTEKLEKAEKTGKSKKAVKTQ